MRHWTRNPVGLAAVAACALAASAAALAAQTAAPAQTSSAAQTPAPAKAATPPPAAAPVPAGRYKLDPAHASLVFRADHLGFSHWVGRFTRFDADLNFDPSRPAAGSVNVKVQTNSLDADNAPAGFLDALRGPEWLDAKKYPTIEFRSTRVESLGGNRLKITGNFTLHGVTRPLVLDATYNGGYAGHPMDPHARIGFSARATLLRSEFGVSYGIPAPGSTMGVGDRVEIVIESEFTGPPLKQ